VNLQKIIYIKNVPGNINENISNINKQAVTLMNIIKIGTNMKKIQISCKKIKLKKTAC
jgi:hypothetical protein